MSLKRLSALPLLAALFAVMIRMYFPVALAQETQEIVITSNGSGSSNEVVVSSSTTTTVTQSNEANVINSVDTSANTGGNEATANSGDATISTGDITEAVLVENEVNSSSVDVGCCPSGSDVTIAENGAGSSNAVSISETVGNQISVSQNATVSNNVSGSANTGYNTASFNGGDVAIDTGNIFVWGGIINGPINISQVSGGSGGGGFSANISNNGSFSNNLITALFADLSSINTSYNANIQNSVHWDLSTGGNEAIANNGDVTIRTGDIFFDFIIKNGPINVGGVDWGCCHPPSDGGNGGPPPGDGDGDGDGDGSKGSDPGSSSSGAGAGGFILALADTSGDGYPLVLIGLGMIAAGASLVNKKKFV